MCVHVNAPSGSIVFVVVISRSCCLLLGRSLALAAAAVAIAAVAPFKCIIARAHFNSAALRGEPNKASEPSINVLAS